MLDQIFKQNAYQENAEKAVSRNDVAEWLKDALYNGEKPNNKSGAQRVALLGYINSKGYDIEAPILELYKANSPTPPHVQNLIIEHLELLAYLIEKNPKEVVDKAIGGRQLACGEGTLNAIQATINDIISVSAGIDTIAVASKRIVLEQICLSFLKLPMFDDDDQFSEPGMETHNVAALLNILAPTYGLVEKTLQEDVHMARMLHYKDKLREPLLQYVENKLQTKEYQDRFFGGIVNSVGAALQMDIDPNRAIVQGEHRQNIDPALTELQNRIDRLNIIGLSVAHIVNVENGVVKAYKRNWSDILQDIVRENFAQKEMLESDALRSLRIEWQKGTYDDGISLLWCETHITPIANDTEKLKTMLLYAIQYDLKFFADDYEESKRVMNPVEYILSNNVCMNILRANNGEFWHAIIEHGSIDDVNLLLNDNIDAPSNDVGFYLKILKRDNIEIADKLIPQEFDILNTLVDNNIYCPNIFARKLLALQDDDKQRLLQKCIVQNYKNGIKLIIPSLELHDVDAKQILSLAFNPPGDFDLLKTLIDSQSSVDVSIVFSHLDTVVIDSVANIFHSTSKEFSMKFIKEYLKRVVDLKLISIDKVLEGAENFDIDLLKAIYEQCPDAKFTRRIIYNMMNKVSEGRLHEVCFAIERGFWRWF